MSFCSTVLVGASDIMEDVTVVDAKYNVWYREFNLKYK